MIYTYAYPRPAVTADIIVFKPDENKILLIERKNEPFKNMWALPGGFVDIDEEVENSAYRELQEETSIQDIKLFQFRAYGKVDRDPRGRTISIVYYGLLKNTSQTVRAGDDAKNIQWHSLENLPQLGFDHNEIIHDFIEYKKSS